MSRRTSANTVSICRSSQSRWAAIELTPEQARLLECFSPEFRERDIEFPHTGALVAVDTFFVGVLKGVGKTYQQTVIDCYSRHAWARLFTNKLPVTAVQTLSNDVLPVFEEQGAVIDAVPSDNGREFCGRADQHPCELFLQLEGIAHTTTRDWAHILQMVSTSENTLQPYDIRWLNEIIAVINRAVGGVIISPQCVLFSRSGDIRHRFVFSHVKRGSNKKFICEFIVCEDVSGPAKNVPASLLSLMTSIRMATRIRHEFIDFIKFKEAQTSEAISDFISQKRSLIFAILTEAETRGSVDLPNLLEAFNNPLEKNRVEIMSYLWPSIAEGLGIDVETLRKSSYVLRKLSNAAEPPGVRTEEVTAFERSLVRLDWMNKEFLAVACRQLGERYAMTDEDLQKARVINVLESN